MLILIALVPGAALMIFDQLMPHHQRRISPLSFANIRVFDLLDPLFIVPFMSVVMRIVNHIVFTVKQPRDSDQWLQWLSHLLFVGYVYGSAVHFAANAIHVYATELNDYKGILPDELYQLIYFLDEDLGHWVMFSCLFFQVALFVIVCDVPSAHGEWLVLICAAWMGITWSVGIIEGSHAWMGFAAGGILLAASAIARWFVPRRYKDTPMLVFTVTLAITLPLGELMYYAAVGSFAQPSELGGTSAMAELVLTRARRMFAAIGIHVV